MPVARVAASAAGLARSHAAVAFHPIGVVLVTAAGHDDALGGLDALAVGHKTCYSPGLISDEALKWCVVAPFDGLGAVLVEVVVEHVEDVVERVLVLSIEMHLSRGGIVELAPFRLFRRAFKAAVVDVEHILGKAGLQAKHPRRVLGDACGEGLEHIVGDGLA